MIPKLNILCGDALTEMRKLPDASVHCCVTSPPYWGLRDYGHPDQLGQEKTLGEYIENMVAVCREVHRVLRPDGTFWFNISDSYASAWSVGGQNGRPMGSGSLENGKKEARPNRLVNGLKEKDLCLIPFRLALAFQQDGWYVRSDIIWAKRNCMPESVTDRPTRSHEHIFLLTKSERYFYDYEAIKEPCVYDIEKRIGQKNFANQGQNTKELINGNRSHRKVLENLKKRADKQRGHSRRHEGFNDRWDQMEREEQCTGMRNKRDVWTVAPANYDGAHFATYPPELIKPCILAGTSAHGCCAQCSAPYERIVEKGEPDLEHQRACGGDKAGEYHGEATKDYAQGGAQDASATKARILAGMRERITTGWKPTCKCSAQSEQSADVIPCTVLDPFGGSGTTGEVALELGRSAILIELNPAHIPLIEERCAITPGLALA